MTNRYTYTGPLNGGYAIQDKAITWELRDFCMSTYEWQEFFAADGVTDHREKFIERFGRWIRSSELNTIDGLDAFSHVTQTNGTSEAFSMFMQRHSNRNFKFYKGDFMMHKVASNNLNAKWEWIFNYGQVKENDAVIISCPFSDTGSIKEDMDQLLEWCSSLQVPVLIDMAYFGMCYGLNINVDQPCVEEVTFSLGKTFPLIGARAGIRFQKEEIDDPVLFTNQHGIVNNFAAMVGQFALEIAGPDYIVDKYKQTQIEFCKLTNTQPSSTVLFGLGGDDWKEYNRGSITNRLSFHNFLNKGILDDSTIK